MREEVKKWWLQAESDLDKARILLEAEKYDGTIFYSQQTIEKALKALWIAQNKSTPPKYHDLMFFFKSLGLPQQFKVACEDLTGGYITTRYPTDVEVNFTEKETKSQEGTDHRQS